MSNLATFQTCVITSLTASSKGIFDFGLQSVEPVHCFVCCNRRKRSHLLVRMRTTTAAVQGQITVNSQSRFVTATDYSSEGKNARVECARRTPSFPKSASQFIIPPSSCNKGRWYLYEKMFLKNPLQYNVGEMKALKQFRV